MPYVVLLLHIMLVSALHTNHLLVYYVQKLKPKLFTAVCIANLAAMHYVGFVVPQVQTVIFLCYL